MVVKSLAWKARVPEFQSVNSVSAPVSRVTLDRSLDSSVLGSWCVKWGHSFKRSHLIQRTDSLEKTLMLGKTEAGGEGEDRG